MDTFEEITLFQNRHSVHYVTIKSNRTRMDIITRMMELRAVIEDR